VGVATKRHKEFEPQKGTKGSKRETIDLFMNRCYFFYVPFVPFCGKPSEEKLNPIAVSLFNSHTNSFLLEVIL